MACTCRAKFREWAQIKGDRHLAADIDHSALLTRLLAGIPALPEPPPRAFSYPWYSLVETGRADRCEAGPWENSAAVFEDGLPHFIINQAAEWVVQRQLGPSDYVVKWQNTGPEYRVWETDLPGPFRWSVERLPVASAD